MSYDSQGNFTRLHNWEQDRQNDVEIMSDRHDEEDDNFAEGLNECLLRDGRVALSGNLNMGNYQIKNVAQASADNDAVNLAQTTEMKNEILRELRETVSVIYFIGDIKASLQTVNHGDWLLCNGQEISRTEYADLFELLGTHFGGGDGINTFNLPDYRGKFLRGLGGNSASDIYTTQAEGLPNITGDAGVAFADGFAGAFSSNSPWFRIAANSETGYSTTYSKMNASNSNAIYGASEHVTPVNQAVNYFIKAKG